MNKKLFHRLTLLGAAVLIVSTIGFAKDYPMTATSLVPGARAQLQVDNQKDGNVQLELKASRLARPGRLTPAANTYVVWVQQEGSQPTSSGELKVGKDLKGELKTATTLHTFNVFVTAETDSQATVPSDQVVLQATVQENN